MSAFTSGGFSPIPMKARGSRLTDRFFRTARQQQLSNPFSVLYVYLEGWTRGAQQTTDACDMTADTADAMYHAAKAAGMHHGEALDEVFLSGYVAGLPEYRLRLLGLLP